MPEKNYSKRELDTALGVITEHLKKQDTTLEKILVQATYTNGKVAKLIWWKNSFVWALGALWALVIIAFPLLRHIVQLEIQDSVNRSVSSALSQFNIIIK